MKTADCAASDIRNMEHKTHRELWGMAEEVGLKPNPCLNRWVRWVEVQTVVNDPVRSFGDFLAIDSRRYYPDVMKL